MALIHFGERVFDAGLVIFDKDGTLIDFAHAWGGKTIQWIETLVQIAGMETPSVLRSSLRADLFLAWGYDPEEGRFAAQGPMVTASLAKLFVVAATVLYQHGIGWLDAELMVRRTQEAVRYDDVAPEMFRTFADLPVLFGNLRAAGVAVAVVTSDDETPTRTMLEMLGALGLVDFVAGADSGYGEKPDPGGALAACRVTGVDPARTAIVGDSTTDMLMAKRAGAGLCVAVASGFASEALLAPTADFVLTSIAEIRT